MFLHIHTCSSSNNPGCVSDASCFFSICLRADTLQMSTTTDSTVSRRCCPTRQQSIPVICRRLCVTYNDCSDETYALRLQGFDLSHGYSHSHFYCVLMNFLWAAHHQFNIECVVVRSKSCDQKFLLQAKSDLYNDLCVHIVLRPSVRLSVCVCPHVYRKLHSLKLCHCLSAIENHRYVL